MAHMGIRPTALTLGSYREKNAQLAAWARRWGLPAAGWQPAPGLLERDGTHFHLRADLRRELYRAVAGFAGEAWRGMGHTPAVALCKESHAMRRDTGLGSACNCLALRAGRRMPVASLRGSS